MRLLGECVHNGGYNVTSEILSFLSPAHLPIQITPTRWARDPENLILFMRVRYEHLQEEKSSKETAMEAVIDQQRSENEVLKLKIAKLEYRFNL